MTIFTGIIVYLLIWWTALFTVLPWGLQHEKTDPGHAGGAPVRPRLKLKILVTTGISAIIWGVIFILIESGIIDFRAIATTMMAEDLN